MKFKLDENLPIEAAIPLRDRGCDVHSVHDEQLRGAPDSTVAQVCQREQRILITLDLDFADIRHYPPAQHCGLIVLRLARQDRESVIAMIPRILELLETESVAGFLWIVDETRTRIRGET